MSEGDLNVLRIVGFFGGIILLGWLIRRYIREHHQDKVQWWMHVVVPRAKRWAVWIFGATMLLWAIVHASAPDEAREDFGRQVEKLFKPMLGGDEEAPQPPPGEKR